MHIEIFDEEDIQSVVRCMVTSDPYFVTNIFSQFLITRYGITLEQFDKIVNSTIPEDMI